MQEEVENRSVNLAINTTKLTARTLARAFWGYLRHKNGKKLKNGVRQQVKKKTVAELMQASDKLTTIEIADTDIAGFEKFARKYRIDYEIKLDESVSPPKYLVFFKAEDGKDMTRAFKGYLASVMGKEEKTSVLEQLKKMEEKVHLTPKKVRNRDKEHSL